MNEGSPEAREARYQSLCETIRNTVFRALIEVQLKFSEPEMSDALIRFKDRFDTALEDLLHKNPKSMKELLDLAEWSVTDLDDAIDEYSLTPEQRYDRIILMHIGSTEALHDEDAPEGEKSKNVFLVWKNLFESLTPMIQKPS